MLTKSRNNVAYFIQIRSQKQNMTTDLRKFNVAHSANDAATIHDKHSRLGNESKNQLKISFGGFLNPFEV